MTRAAYNVIGFRGFVQNSCTESRQGRESRVGLRMPPPRHGPVRPPAESSRAHRATCVRGPRPASRSPRSGSSLRLHLGRDGPGRRTVDGTGPNQPPDERVRCGWSARGRVPNGRDRGMCASGSARGCIRVSAPDDKSRPRRLRGPARGRIRLPSRSRSGADPDGSCHRHAGWRDARISIFRIRRPHLPACGGERKGPGGTTSLTRTETRRTVGRRRCRKVPISLDCELCIV